MPSHTVCMAVTSTVRLRRVRQCAACSHSAPRHAHLGDGPEVHVSQPWKVRHHPKPGEDKGAKARVVSSGLRAGSDAAVDVPCPAPAEPQPDEGAASG